MTENQGRQREAKGRKKGGTSEEQGQKQERTKGKHRENMKNNVKHVEIEGKEISKMKNEETME